jgi:hypothetical protein
LHGQWAVRSASSRITTGARPRTVYHQCRASALTLRSIAECRPAKRLNRSPSVARCRPSSGNHHRGKMSCGVERNYPVAKVNQSDHIERQVGPKRWLARRPDKKDRDASNPSTKSSRSQIGVDATQRPEGHKTIRGSSMSAWAIGLTTKGDLSASRRQSSAPRIRRHDSWSALRN